MSRPSLTDLLKSRGLAWTVFVATFAVTLYFGQYARIERIDNRLEDNVIHGEALSAYYRYLETFGNDRILLAAFPAPKIDNPLVRMLFSTELALMKHPNVQTVLSPVTALRVNLGVKTPRDLERFLGEENQLNRYLENLKKTTSMNRLIISPDWQVGGLIIRLKQETGDLVGPTLTEIRTILDANMPLGTRLTGVPEITRLILDMTRRDQRMFSPLTILLMAIVLAILYRSWFGMFVPLFAMISSLIWTKGLMMAMGNSVNFVTAIVPPMVLSVSLTFVMHVLTEYFEASRTTATYDPALLSRSLKHVFEPFLISGLATIIGFGSLMYQSIDAIAQFGLYSALGTFFSMVLGFLILPAGIIIGRRTGASVASVAWLETDVGRLTRLLLKYPRRVWTIAALLMAVAFYGISILPIETSLIRFLPSDHEIQEANRFVENNLCGIVPIEIFMESGQNRWTEVDMVHRVRRFQEDVASIAILDKSLSYVDLIQDFDRMFSGEPNHIPPSEEEICDYLSFYSPTVASDTEDEIPTDASGTSLEAQKFVVGTFTAFPTGGMLGEFIASDAMTTHVSLRLRDSTSRTLVETFDRIKGLLKKHFADLPVRTILTGRAALWAEVSQSIAYNEITSFAMSLTIITLLMSLFFRSLKIGLVAIIPNVVPVIMTYGCMGLTGTEFSTATGMIASIAIGLAVDDTIHILCQYRHELQRDGNEREAIVRTMVHKGRATFLSMVVLCPGFVVLAFSSFSPTRFFGIFISIGVALDLLCELLITPVVLLAFKPFPIPPQESDPHDGGSGPRAPGWRILRGPLPPDAETARLEVDGVPELGGQPGQGTPDGGPT